MPDSIKKQIMDRIASDQSPAVKPAHLRIYNFIGQDQLNLQNVLSRERASGSRRQQYQGKCQTKRLHTFLASVAWRLASRKTIRAASAKEVGLGVAR